MVVRDTGRPNYSNVCINGAIWSNSKEKVATKFHDLIRNYAALGIDYYYTTAIEEGEEDYSNRVLFQNGDSWQEENPEHPSSNLYNFAYIDNSIAAKDIMENIMPYLVEAPFAGFYMF
jgi:hypothetical protein